MSCGDGNTKPILRFRLGVSTPTTLYTPRDSAGAVVRLEVVDAFDESAVLLDISSAAATADGSISLSATAPDPIPAGQPASPWTKLAITISEAKKAELQSHTTKAVLYWNGTPVLWPVVQVVSRFEQLEVDPADLEDLDRGWVFVLEDSGVFLVPVGEPGPRGNDGQDGAGASHHLTQIIVGNGGRAFALTPAPNANSILFAVNGLLESDYGMSGDTLVPNFDFADGDTVEVWWRG